MLNKRKKTEKKLSELEGDFYDWDNFSWRILIKNTTQRLNIANNKFLKYFLLVDRQSSNNRYTEYW